MVENVIQISDDDTVRIGDSGLTTSGRVLRLMAEDAFGRTVDQYIADAQRGRALRSLERQTMDLTARKAEIEDLKRYLGVL
jgi:hypothetical protein